MTKIKVKVKGLRALERSLAKLGKTTTKKAVARTALKKGGMVFVKKAIALAPDDPKTGAPDLHRSIKILSRTSGGRSAIKAANGPGAVNVFAGPLSGMVQAIPQEFGTISHAANPYMRPAWDTTKMRVLVTIRKELGRAIDRAIKRQAAKGL